MTRHLKENYCYPSHPDHAGYEPGFETQRLGIGVLKATPESEQGQNFHFVSFLLS